MAVLTRKGGGLPANYREDYFWLNRMEVPEKEPVRGQAGAQAEQAEAAKAAAAEVATEVAPEIVPDVATAMPEAAEVSAVAAERVEEPVAETVTADEPVTELTNAAAESVVAEVAPEIPAEVPAEMVEGLAEVAAEEPVAEKTETPVAGTAEVEKSEASEAEPGPKRKMGVVQELPRRGGTMLGLDAESATEETAAQDAAEASATDEDARGRGFWGFRRKKRA